MRQGEAGRVMTERPAVLSAYRFRAILAALARPGSIQPCPGVSGVDGVSPAAAAVLETLSDPGTPVHLGACGTPELRRWLAFATGAPVAVLRAEAVIALGTWAMLLPLDAWPVGTAEFPDRSATLIVEVERLEGGPTLRLSGPGIEGERRFAPGLPDDAASVLVGNAAAAPLGVDFLFTAGEAIAALPRSTRIGG